VAENLELKARLSSIAHGRSVACSLPASFGGILHQTDTYFVVPHGRCKLREFGDGTAELISYHRESAGTERWSRYLKVPVGDPGALRSALLMVLGELATVRKTRQLYLVEGARIHLDEVDGLGAFIEFEVTSGDRSQRAAMMARLRSAFGIREEECFRGSYADMIAGGVSR
jgi:predicted adenylyl cyclase CyaB